MENCLQNIDNLIKEGKFQEAFELCNKELQRVDANEPDSLQTSKYIAALYYAMSKCVEPKVALQCMDLAIHFVGNNSDYYLQRGQIKQALEDYQGALEDYSIIIEHEPRFEAFGFRGGIYLNAGNLEESLNDYNKALEMNPNYGGGYVGRGRIKYAKNDLEGAIKDFDIAIKLYPDYPVTYGFRGNAKADLNDFEGALADFRKVLELNPEDIGAKKAFLNLKIHLAAEGSISTITFTKKDGTQVQQFMTDEGIIELPLEK